MWRINRASWAERGTSQMLPPFARVRFPLGAHTFESLDSRNPCAVTRKHNRAREHVDSCRSSGRRSANLLSRGKRPRDALSRERPQLLTPTWQSSSIMHRRLHIVSDTDALHAPPYQALVAQVDAILARTSSPESSRITSETPSPARRERSTLVRPSPAALLRSTSTCDRTKLGHIRAHVSTPLSRVSRSPRETERRHDTSRRDAQRRCIPGSP